MSNIHESGCCCKSRSDEDAIKEEHSCNKGGCCHQKEELIISDEEAEILMQLAQTPFLPLARFLLRSSKSGHLESVALAPVYINDKYDNMERVKTRAEALENLASQGLITLDYNEPLANGNYQDYLESELYIYFTQTVEQAKGKEGFLFDIPNIELGSIALTALGQAAIRQIDSLS